MLFQFIRAEVKIAVLMAENNIPLAFSNHLSRMLPKLFPDSKIAQKYSAAATKITCMINGAIAPTFLKGDGDYHEVQSTLLIN